MRWAQEEQGIIMTTMVAIKGLTKRFGHLLAVDNISLDISQGEVLGFLGPNGSGKSTTMKMITGFLTPTFGTAQICGIDVLEDPIQAQRHIGYLPEGAPAYGDMTPEAYLEFIADVRRLSGDDRDAAIARAVGLTHLDRVLYQPIDTLSKGYKRRVGLAQALLHDPDVLILDEPTDGLDPNQKYEVRTLIQDMSEEKAIVISTHILEEVEAVCSRAVIISDGRIVADGTPEDLENRSRYYNSVSLSLPSVDVEVVRNVLSQFTGVAAVEYRGDVGASAELVAIPADGGDILADVSRLVRESGWEVDQIRLERGHLDEVFRTITTSKSPLAGSRDNA